MTDNKDLGQGSLFDDDTHKKALPVTKKTRKKAIKETPIKAVYNYGTDELPQRVKDLIELHLEITKTDAKNAGTLGFMARRLAIATLPHSRISEQVFTRKNGDFTLTVASTHPKGIPFGTIPRLLLNWLCTEAVKTRTPEIVLGASLRDAMDEIGIIDNGLGYQRFREATETLFSAFLSCRYVNEEERFAINNVLFADEATLERDFSDEEWWKPQTRTEYKKTESRVLLSDKFFKECIESPVPVDLRAIGSLRQSPLAIDIYIWLSLRFASLSRSTTIPWVLVANQFGSGYDNTTEQGLRDFKRAFLREAKKVVTLYPATNMADSKNGLILKPSPLFISKK
jgi:hypothetical protein